ncbi:MAG: RagB/SusD family nutrient uptake outer membrane protein [Prevotella sp.]|nr:RagB/SusD family nutrient uptake outer membrane protein [Prevotella sp.]
MITKISKKLLIGLSLTVCYLSAGTTLTSCKDLLDTDSELVEFQEDNRLNSPTDSVYSVMGIIYKMQIIADRTVLLGELRGDLTTPTNEANADLKAVANFEVTTDNRYNQISDYYAVINNCNYFLATVDTTLERHGRKIFESEYAAVKAFRAWTYLQAALVYGNVPLVTEPLLTEQKAEEAMNQPYSDITTICNYFISDLQPYVDTKVPQYGSIGGLPSEKFFIPVRALLGDLCLWAGRYQEAATFYHDYLTLRTAPITTGINQVRWASETKDFLYTNGSISNSFISPTNNNEFLSFLPMESSEYEGVYSQLENIFNSTRANNYYAQAEPAAALKALSASQNYCMRYQRSDGQTDTLYAPKTNLLDPLMAGDLRLYDAYLMRIENQDQNSKYSSRRQTVRKLFSGGISLYRTNIVYLHFAEALNRAGYPQSAFTVLKHGLYQQTISEQVDSVERAQAGQLLSFDVNTFTIDNTIGIHARGCGNVDADTLYTLPQPLTAGSRADTVAYQQPLVEDLIVTELALETAFEGQRYYDLMRIALRRSDPDYLAKRVSLRNGQRDDALYNRLMDTRNWYLPKP